MKISEMLKTFGEGYKRMPLVMKGLALLAAAGLLLVTTGRVLRGPERRWSNRTMPAEVAPQTGEVEESANDDRDGKGNVSGDREYFGAENAPSANLKLDAQATAHGMEELQSRAGRMDPLIAQSAHLAVATKEFARSRTQLGEILERHNGYASRLRMVGQKQGSALNAMLRVPATELSGTIVDLKTLGEVEREEEAADEVTQARAEIDARLVNARNTLRRLQELLQKQTYPDGNVRELQRQIANATAEVGRIEAERKANENRVVFANVRFSLREEVTAPAETLAGQVSAAAKEGFGDAAASLSALLVLMIGRGPLVALWGVILFVPTRFVWRKLQSRPQAAATAQV
jgi:hypothetical protein